MFQLKRRMPDRGRSPKWPACGQEAAISRSTVEQANGSAAGLPTLSAETAQASIKTWSAASDSYKFELKSDVLAKDGALSGT